MNMCVEKRDTICISYDSQCSFTIQCRGEENKMILHTRIENYFRRYAVVHKQAEVAVPDEEA